jgi:actin-like protein 6A
VLDIGTSTIRAGYAGDDTPKAVIPTSYGYIADQETEDMNMDDQGTANGDQSTTANTTEKQKKMSLFVGQHGPSLYRAGMEIGNPMQGAMSEFHSSSATH